MALVGTGCNLEWLINKELLISGPEAAAFVEPEEKTVKFYLKQQQEYYTLKQRQKSIAEEKNLTKDNVEIKLMANINSVNDIKEANENGAQGVGLFRSEYLFINGVLPSTEDEQFEVYKQLLLCNKKANRWLLEHWILALIKFQIIIRICFLKHPLPLELGEYAFVCSILIFLPNNCVRF